MRHAPLLPGLLALFLTACGSGDLLTRLSPELKEVEQRQRETKLKLDTLGVPMLGQTAPQFGFVTNPKSADSKEEWVQVNLDESCVIDQIVLIPAQVEWDQLDRTTYHFPTRFRVDISDDQEFRTSTPVCVFADEDFPNPDITPVVLPVHGMKANHIRVTVQNPALFALAEVMVMKGNRNVAIGCGVDASTDVAFFTRWGTRNLVDGRTPLGPPIRRELLPYDGLYAGPTQDGSPVWMQLDLGKEVMIEEVRLHPVHGRTGVDIPGYLFPPEFRLKSSAEPDFKSPQVLFESGPFSNPRNNVVTVPTHGARGRYVRIELVTDNLPAQDRRMALSEIEVYSDGVNVARQAAVEAVKDGNPARKDRPKDLLVDGCSSYGRIIELPAWLNHWTLRKDLKIELAKLTGQQARLMITARQRLWWLLIGVGLLVAGCATALALHTRRVRQQELNRFRKRLTQDFHDEVGSNLAAIGVISEVALDQPTPPGFDYWRNVKQITREAADAMRETLWVAGGHEEQRIDLMAHLQLVAQRMLPERKVEWTSVVEAFPVTWPMEDRRQVFLFFKETLANVVRHSRANTVTLSARLVDGWFELEIRDNGQGFSPTKNQRGIGLESLRERAAQLGGTLTIETAPGQGTHVALRLRIEK